VCFMSIFDITRTSNGYKTRSLFVDVCKKFFMDEESIKNAPYWLDIKTDLKDPRPSVRDHFLVSEDPTGYETALKFFGCYEHWEFMYSKSDWFKEAVDTWKLELYARLKSKAVRKIRDIAFSDDDKQALAAAKYLATAEYDKVDGRGRPSAAEVKGKLKEAVKILDADREDMERIGLRLVK